MKKKKTKKQRLTTAFLVLLFFVGLSLLLYPTVSDAWNQHTASRAIASYAETVSGMSDEDYAALMAQAEEYNEHLAALSFPFTQYEELEDEYAAALDVTGTGIMGYITIESIQVELPVYHGTSEAVLQIAAGHLEGTSLPSGGEGNHSVISAHRGLPSAKLFTDLDQLEVGDIFQLTVLNETLTYQVDQILIVEPQQLEALGRVSGEDYCTLMTCTPYGINTHRLLIRGTRIENPALVLDLSSEARELDDLTVIPAVALPLLLLLLGGLLVKYRRKKRKF